MTRTSGYGHASGDFGAKFVTRNSGTIYGPNILRRMGGVEWAVDSTNSTATRLVICPALLLRKAISGRKRWFFSTVYIMGGAEIKSGTYKA